MLTLETLESNVSNYRYPYGTALTVDDLHDISVGADLGYKIITTDPAGVKHEYILRVVPGTDHGESTKDGKPWDFSIIGYEYLFESGLLTADEVYNDMLQTYWFDAVLREDAEAHLDAANAANPNFSHNKYGGNDIESQLERIELDIVEYSDHFVALDSLYGRGGLKKWLEARAPRQVLGWEFYTLDDSKIPSIDGKDYLLLQAFHTEDDNQTETPHVTFIPHAYKPGITPEEYLAFLTGEGDVLPLESYLGFRLDGCEITHFDAENVLGYERVKSMLTPATPADLESMRWLALRAPGLPMVLLIPPTNVVLHLHTDEDGAMTALQVHDLELTHVERQRDEMFVRRWGKYLDENRVITDADCAADIEYLHGLLKEGK